MSSSRAFVAAAVAVLLAASPTLAQETADGIPETGDDLSLGQSTEPQVGETYTREEFGDWELRCVRMQEGSDPCQLYQLLSDEDGNSVAEISMFPVTDGGAAVAGATVVTPLETLLSDGVRLSVDGGVAKVYPFNFCSQIGCFSRVGFTADEVQSFREGNVANMLIVPAAVPTETVNLTVSLTGFTAGFAAVEEAMAAAGQ